MVVREQQAGEAEGHLCIAQSQHAAIAGQLARAWGNEAFPSPRPRAEICLAAQRHDDGMDAFDEQPGLDPETGLPRSFMRMPLDAWLDCWERGPALVAEDSAYAGLLVSLHGEHLLGYRRLDEEREAGRERAERWLAGQRELRESLRERAADEEDLEEYLDEATVECARKLIEIWDAMSLALCMPRLPESFSGVPCEGEGREILMREVGQPGGPIVVEVDPWPFSSTAEVPLAAAGRRIPGGYESDEQMREALGSAGLETLSLSLLPWSRVETLGADPASP